jgi:hypothetical protein
LDVLLLALLGSAAQQQNQVFAVFAKVDAVAGAKIELGYSNTPEPTPFTFERFPFDIRITATETFAAAAAFRSLNQSA